MTIMHSLRSRILLARATVQFPLAGIGGRLPGLVLGGADVAVLTTSGTVDQRRNLKILRDLERYLGQRVLLAIDTSELEADVWILFPGGQDRLRPHQWVLLGQAVQEQRQIVKPGGAFQFLVVPGSSPGSPLLRAAVENQSPLRRDSAPWFVAGGFDTRSIQALVETGVRHVWSTESGTVEELEQIDGILRRAWGEDPAYKDYLDFAVRARNPPGRPVTNWYYEACLSLQVKGFHHMTNPFFSPIPRRTLSGLIPILLTLGLTGCESGGTSGGGDASSPASVHTVTHDLGETVINGTPKQIVSTSVVLTGTLLALDAPVVGSGTSKPGAEGFDDVGFFPHQSATTKERDVEALYVNSKLDIEAVTVEKLDLIIITSTRGDDIKDNYDPLSRIAPAVAINYNSESWQIVTRKVASVIGTQARAEEPTKAFNSRVTELKARVSGVPTNPVQVIVYAPSNGLSFAKPGGPHDEVLSALGFKPAEAPASSGEEGVSRGDFVFVMVKQSVQALTSETLLLVSEGDKAVEQLKAGSNYSTIQTVSSSKLVPLKISSFKLDYYSTLAMAETLTAVYSR